MIFSLIPVRGLPYTESTEYETEFGGASALPSLSGKGAYVQHNQHFYELECNPNKKAPYSSEGLF